MSQEGAVRRLVARLTGQRLLDQLAVVEEKVGAFGRAQRETLAAQGRQIEALQAGLSTRASADAVRALEQRVEELQHQVRHQDRTVSDALERARVLDDQGMDDRRFTRRMEDLLQHERPVIVGPWTGEVGFELIYWVPFVRWVITTYRIPPERVWVVSRGGTRAWYGDMAAHYVDAFEFCSPDAFRSATDEAKKQRRVGAFDAEIVKRVTAAYGLGRPDLLHPGMMYRLFMPYWKDLASMTRVEERAVYERLAPGADPAPTGLPDEYVAARFYFSECFPDTPANRSFVASTIDGLSRQAPVVLLNTPFAVDDHRDVDASGSRVFTIAAHMSPERNLAVQTAVIARARAFVGTYGGYSYLAPFCGVPSVAFYSDRSFKVHHLHVAQQIFATLGGPTLVPMDVAATPLVRLALAGGVATAP
jgi:hypothetical protein